VEKKTEEVMDGADKDHHCMDQGGPAQNHQLLLH
jgi:hypothetical protein